jgi:hypothetical protein
MVSRKFWATRNYHRKPNLNGGRKKFNRNTFYSEEEDVKNPHKSTNPQKDKGKAKQAPDPVLEKVMQLDSLVTTVQERTLRKEEIS